MTNDNNTRKKANAVFFSAIMVISMLAVGFAAAPAAATTTDGEVTFNNQGLDADGNVTVEDVTTNDSSSPVGDATVLVTYNDGSDEIVVGSTNVSDLDGEDVGVAIESEDGFPGFHTAHIANQSEAGGLEEGDAVPDLSVIHDSDSAHVGDRDDYDRQISQGNTVYQGQLVLVDAEDLNGTTPFGPDEVELRNVDDGEVAGLASAPSVQGPDGGQFFILNTETVRPTDMS